MAHDRPKLDWEELHQLPASLLTRRAQDLLDAPPHDAEEEATPVTAFGSVGGQQRQALQVRAGSYSRTPEEGVQRTFVFPIGSQHGNGQSSKVTAKRLTFTTEQLRQMRDGLVKPPAGLTEKMVNDSIREMEKREQAIANNNAQAARHKKLVAA